MLSVFISLPFLLCHTLGTGTECSKRLDMCVSVCVRVCVFFGGVSLQVKRSGKLILFREHERDTTRDTTRRLEVAYSNSLWTSALSQTVLVTQGDTGTEEV